MKKFLTSTAIALALAGPALAQTNAVDPNASATAQAQIPFAEHPAQGSVTASDLIGARLYTSENEISADAAGLNNEWDDVGEIHDIVLSKDGKIDYIIADIGGFLGIGEKQIAVNMSDLRFVRDGNDPDDWFLVLQAGRGDLEGAPIYDGATYRDQAATTHDQQQMNATNDPAMADSSNAATTTTDTTVTGSVNTGTTEDENAINGKASDTASVAGSTDTGAAPKNDQAALKQGSEESDMNVTVTDNAKTEDGSVSGSATVTSESAKAEINTDGASATAESQAQPMDQDGYAMAEVNLIPVEEITGQRVYDLNGEWIGEVHEVIGEGEDKQAVIDVGGFLGLGEKPVAVSLKDLKIQRTEDGGDMRIYVDATKDQLEQMPEYNRG